MTLAPELVLCTNGPGELYTWAGPVLRAVRAARPDLRVVCSLLPCPFASGQELRVARELGFDGVTTVTEYLAFAAGGRRPAAYQPGPGLVLGLGGDAAHAVRVAGRLGRPAWRYSFEPYWHAGLERLFVHDERTRDRAAVGRAPADRVEVAGNLVADALDREPPAARRHELEVLLFAGSRRFEAVHMLGLLAAAADLIAAAVPRVGFAWPRSRLLDDAAFELARSACKVLDVGGVPTRPDVGGVPTRPDVGGVPTRPDVEGLVTDRGTRIRVAPEEERYALMRSADLALTIPGTNTLELGIAGVPSVVSLPLQKPELIPLEGPAQYVGLVPLLGPLVKRAVATAVLARLEHVALPNLLARERIQPELRGDVRPAAIAAEAVALLRDPARRAGIRARLRETMPAPGTAARLTGRILERLELAPGIRVPGGAAG